MTIKKVSFQAILILISYFIMLSLLMTIFGSDGILVSRSLKQYYTYLEQEEEIYKLRIASLEERRRSAADQSSMDDIALSLGYNRQGEKVYYFDDADEIDDSTVIAYTDDRPALYKPVSSSALALWALIAPALVLIAMVIRRIISGRSTGYTESRYEGGAGYDDYDF